MAPSAAVTVFATLPLPPKVAPLLTVVAEAREPFTTRVPAETVVAPV